MISCHHVLSHTATSAYPGGAAKARKADYEFEKLLRAHTCTTERGCSRLMQELQKKKACNVKKIVWYWLDVGIAIFHFVITHFIAKHDHSTRLGNQKFRHAAEGLRI